MIAQELAADRFCQRIVVAGAICASKKRREHRVIVYVLLKGPEDDEVATDVDVECEQVSA